MATGHVSIPFHAWAIVLYGGLWKTDQPSEITQTLLTVEHIRTS